MLKSYIRRMNVSTLPRPFRYIAKFCPLFAWRFIVVDWFAPYICFIRNLTFRFCHALPPWDGFNRAERPPMPAGSPTGIYWLSIPVCLHVVKEFPPVFPRFARRSKRRFNLTCCKSGIKTPPDFTVCIPVVFSFAA